MTHSTEIKIVRFIRTLATIIASVALLLITLFAPEPTTPASDTEILALGALLAIAYLILQYLQAKQWECTLRHQQLN
jgi:uncharacterized membrane protein YdjX (TVP38/TMEM64 family)